MENKFKIIKKVLGKEKSLILSSIEQEFYRLKKENEDIKKGIEELISTYKNWSKNDREKK